MLLELLTSFQIPETPMQNDDIKDSLEDIRARQMDYRRYSDYYAGRHPLNFATEKFRKTFGAFFGALKDNLCPIVIDTLVDRLDVQNFSAESLPDEAARDPRSTAAWTIWQRNQMERRAAELFRQAFITGDSYAIVWPGPDGRARIHPNRAENCSVRYDAETGSITRAAKMWQTDDKRWRLNLYYPDRIEKYATRNPSEDQPAYASAFQPFETPDDPFPLVNPYSQVPVFHFVNKAEIGFFGNSELRDVDSLQDALNKSLCDMFVAKEFVAFPQRWATGVEPDYDENGKLVEPFKTGVDRIWSVANEAARFGEALKTLESRFAAKVKNAQLSFGQTLADMMKFALRIEDGTADDLELVTQWVNTQPRSEREHLETLLLKQQLGVSGKTLLSEAGYTAEDIGETERGVGSPTVKEGADE
jgi:hypothetical protein